MSKVIPWVLLVAVLVGGVWYAATTRAHYRAERAALTQANDSLRAIADQRDTVFTSDTVRLVRWQTRYDTLYQHADIMDTVWVKQFVVAADSTIKSCTAALTTCEQRVADRDAQIANLNKQIKLERKSKPFLVRLGKPVGVFLGGMLVGKTLLK